jgi:hypothetical protein
LPATLGCRAKLEIRPRSLAETGSVVLLPDRELDDSLQVHRHPCLFADVADADFDFSKRCLDRGRAILAGDGGRSSSDKAASADHHPLIAARAAVAPADNHRQQPLEENVIFQWRPFVHRFAPSLNLLFACPDYHPPALRVLQLIPAPAARQRQTPARSQSHRAAAGQRPRGSVAVGRERSHRGGAHHGQASVG